MTFTNAEVRAGGLPRFDAVELQAVHRHYPRICLAMALAFGGVMVAALAAGCLVAPPLRGFILGPGGWVLPVAVVLLAGLIAWFAYKSAGVIGYALREHDIIVQSGIFWRKQTIQPIRRIQHVEVTRGPLDKRFGLANLRLFSAGTGHLTFEIPGLEVATAERIKGFILRFQQGAA